MNISALENYLKNAREDFFSAPFCGKAAVLSCTALGDYRNALRAEAARLKDEPLCELPFHAFKQYDTTGSRLSYERVYFHRRRCLGIFALMAWLYEEEEYLSLTEDYLWAVCNEFTWALPAHLDGCSLTEHVNRLTLDLFSCETAQTLSEIAALLEGKLNPAVIFRCRSEAEYRVLKPFEARTAPYWWENCHMNWASVCSGSIGMTAIYLIKDDIPRLSSILSQLLPVTEHFLSGFENDGACLEGLSYWTYGMSYFTAFADLLRKRTGGGLDLLAGDKVRAIADFQGKCYFEGGQTVSFSDADAHDTFRIGITNYLARYFDCAITLPPLSSAAGFGTDACARWCQMLRDFVWTAEAVPDSAPALISSPAPEAPVCSYILPDAQWLIFRDAAANGGAIKGGHNAEPHNHNDIGSFFFLLHGSEVLADLGAGEYTKDSFSDKRYTIFTNHSFSHSVPIVNGSGQQAGKEYAARSCVFESCSTPSAVQASMDISPAYGESTLASLVRSLTFDSSAHRLTLCDSYAFTQMPASLTERFVSRQKPVLSDSIVTLYSQSGEACRLAFDADRLSVSLATGVHHRHADGAPETVYLLDFSLKHLTDRAQLTFVLSWA